MFDLAEALFRTDIFNPAVHENHQVLSLRILMLMLWMEPGWEFPRSLPCRHSWEHWLEKPGIVAPACNSVSHKTEARSLSWIWGKLGLQSKTSSQRTGGRGGRGRGQHFHSCLVILISYHSTRSRWAVTSSTWVLFLIPLLVLCACLHHRALTSSSVVQGLVALETIEGWLLPHGFGLYLPFSW